MFRNFLSFIGLALALPLLALIGMAVFLPITRSGIGYLFGALIVVIGLILAPRLSRYHILVIVGMIVVALVAGVRISLLGQDSASSLKMIALPSERETAWVNFLVDEQDGLIFGEALFHRIGGATDNEHEGLTSALLTAYTEMRQEGNFPSPVVSTYLGLQRPGHFDVVVVEPEEPTQFAVVFLHGYMGNVAAQCWEIAQAVKKLGGVTICPSTKWTGEWWQPNGQAILRATFDYVRARGIERIYLGGFSNGGFGISRLASRWKEEKGLAGLFFIDGFTNGTEIREVGLPVLIIEGAQDERVPVAAARQFALEVGDLGTYAEIKGDHFLIMKQPAAVQREIESWLARQEADK
jgi:pimeloyl-ACP methyl ester carboxylesterase